MIADSTRELSTGRQRRLSFVCVVFVSCIVLIASCSVQGGEVSDSDRGTKAGPVAAPTVEIRPEDGQTDVSIVDGARIHVDDGAVVEAALFDQSGEKIEGERAPDGTSWKPSRDLEFAQEYTLRSTIRGDNGEVREDSRTFTTRSPESTVTPSLLTTGGRSIESNREYGVGMVVAANFDSPVLDQDTAAEHMHVSTEPKVEGAWYWVNESTAHWRPRDYYDPGTQVNVEIDTNGVEFGHGQYGSGNADASFTIGASRVTVANDETKQVEVFHDNELVRTMNTSFGVGGWGSFDGTDMHFWTQPGTYTVLGKEESLYMDSSTYGLPTDDDWGYADWYNNGVRLNNGGIYFHENRETIWAQGNTNTSHGCLNLNDTDAQWFFDQAIIGDPVEIINTGGPPLEVWQNGDWSVPWEEWKSGSYGS